MPSTPSEAQPDLRPQPLFLTTRWSVVLTAKDKASPASAQALETLCGTYWLPLYAFIRGSGYPPHDAQDLTQAFFAKLLAKDYLRVVEPEKGRFRTFLRMAVKRFLSTERQRVQAQKRGGAHAQVPFDTTVAEQLLHEDRLDTLPPDEVYDRRWATTLLGNALERLEEEYRATGRAGEFAQLKPYLTAERGAIAYAGIAAALNTSEGAARVAVHRLRKRFREVFREVIADTVSAPEELEAELLHVLQVLSRG